MIRHLSILLATAALAAPLAAMAQTAPTPSGPAAAARLPNTFDRPQAVPTAPAARTAGPAASASAAAAATPSDPAKIAAAEAMLRTTIAAMQAGAPNYGDMTESLAGKVREQSAAITPLIQSFGKMQSLAHVGAENGAELFLVGFDNQITQWIIAQNGEGKIVALLFRPATPPPA